MINSCACDPLNVEGPHRIKRRPRRKYVEPDEAWTLSLWARPRLHHTVLDSPYPTKLPTKLGLVD
jgi:hypothetical protein